MPFYTYQETFKKLFDLQITKILRNIEPYRGQKCFLYRKAMDIQSVQRMNIRNSKLVHGIVITAQVSNIYAKLETRSWYYHHRFEVFEWDLRYVVTCGKP